MKKIIVKLLGAGLIVSCAAPEATKTENQVQEGVTSSVKCVEPSSELNYLQKNEAGVEMSVTLRDFSSAHPDFENFNSKKKSPDINDCGSLDQPELSNYEFKKKFYDQLRERFPLNYHWATLNNREIYPTFKMVQPTLNAEGKPVKGRSACDNHNFNEWFTDVEGVNYRVSDKLQLDKIEEDTYYVEYFHHKDNSYLPLDKFAESKEIKTWGKQNNSEWCKDDQVTCRQVSDDNGKLVNSVPDGHNFGFTMETGWNFVYTSLGNEFLTIDGDDDHWVFVDGKLVVDAGGAHVSTFNKIDFNQLAAENHWAEGSSHSVKLFFAERQTDASNLTLTLKSNLAKSLKELPPYIMELIIVEEEAANREYLVYLNTKLDSVSAASIQNTPHSLSVINSSYDEIGANIKIASWTSLRASELPSNVAAGYKIVLGEDSDLLTKDHKVSFNTKLGFEVKSEAGKVLKTESYTLLTPMNIYKQNKELQVSKEDCQ